MRKNEVFPLFFFVTRHTSPLGGCRSTPQGSCFVGLFSGLFFTIFRSAAERFCFLFASSDFFSSSSYGRRPPALVKKACQQTAIEQTARSAPSLPTAALFADHMTIYPCKQKRGRISPQKRHIRDIAARMMYFTYAYRIHRSENTSASSVRTSASSAVQARRSDPAHCGIPCRLVPMGCSHSGKSQLPRSHVPS